MTPPGARYDRFFRISAAIIGVGAVAQAVLGLLLVGLYGLVPAAAFACIAGYLALYPRLRAGWYEAGHDAAAPSVRIPPGADSGYAIFASEPIGGDPHRQTVMVVARGVGCRALRDAEGRQTTEWIVTLPLPADTRIEQSHIAHLPKDRSAPAG